MFWWRLPNDVRLEILECLPREHMGKFASVCSEWQKFFEPRTMRNLNIRYNRDIVWFRNVFHATHRRRYLRHLALVMDFPPYQRLRYHPPRNTTVECLYRFANTSTRIITDGGEVMSNQDRTIMNAVFGNFLVIIFTLLSQWKQQQAWPRGIHLTIADDSRNSLQALAEAFVPGEAVIYGGTTINTEAQEWSKRVSLANHDWMYEFSRQTFPLIRSIPVRVITHFSIIAKYQNFHPGSLMNIMSLLPSLWKFDCFMRVPEFPRNQVKFSQDMLVFMDSWPSHLREVKILRVPQTRGLSALSAHGFGFPERVSLRLADLTQNLTRLSFQQPIDAFEFFQCQQYEYRNLLNLSICSTHRILDEFSGVPHRPVLAFFADILPQMPNLHTFSLFSLTEGATAVTCFSPKNGGRFSLLWDWPFLLDRATFRNIQKIMKAFRVFPMFSCVVQATSTERIWGQISYINRVSE
ncbi:hypothetical protein ACHAO9_004951 [Fusarium lateritium]